MKDLPSGPDVGQTEPMSGTKKVSQGQFLFREGDASDAMYVVKTGRFAVTKSKTNSEIILAEIGPGSMVGEMAFFDNRPRSANVKALKDSEVIALPFKALRAQFASFPEWAKAIMRTVNDHLRTANARIKQLDNTSTESDELFPPLTTTKLIAILTLVASRYGVKKTEGIDVPSGILRNYTIQVFQEPTNKMQKLVVALTELGHATTQDLGEGQQQIILLHLDLLVGFVEWYNHFLFQREEDRRPISPEEHRVLKVIHHFAKDLPRTNKGLVKLNVTQILTESSTATGTAVRPEEIDAVIARGLMSEKIFEKDILYSQVQMEDLEKWIPYWEIIYKLRSVQR